MDSAEPASHSGPDAGADPRAQKQLPEHPGEPLSEDEILRRILPFLPSGSHTVVGPGDDCAVLAGSAHTLISTDVLVIGQHFRTDWSTGFDVGWRAIMQNAADVAAMGGVAHSYVIGMTIPDDLPIAWIEDCARGMGAALEGSGAGVVGGDLTRGGQLSIAVTVLGEAPGPIVRRDGAQVGDLVVVAGTLGHSAAGFSVLSHWGVDYPQQCHQFAEVFRRPVPVLASGPELAAAGATAMMDVSDGLVRDATRIAHASGVSINLASHLLEPFVSQLADVLPGADPLDWVLHGGEDHGLLACLPAQNAELADVPWAVIGRVEALSGARVCLDGVAADGLGGWDHFARAPEP